MAQELMKPALHISKRVGYPRSSQPAPQTTTQADMVRVVLYVGEKGRPLPLEISGRRVLGIETDEEAPQPDIDLKRFAAQQYGVQRRHVALICEQGDLYIEDLNSERGTRINGLRLSPGKRYRLRNHDELELGELRMSLRFLPR